MTKAALMCRIFAGGSPQALPRRWEHVCLKYATQPLFLVPTLALSFHNGKLAELPLSSYL